MDDGTFQKGNLIDWRQIAEELQAELEIVRRERDALRAALQELADVVGIGITRDIPPALAEAYEALKPTAVRDEVTAHE